MAGKTHVVVVSCAFALASCGALMGEAFRSHRAVVDLVLTSVPADGLIRLTDYGFRDWGPEVVRYSMDTPKFLPGRLVLAREDGTSVPLQIKTEGGRSTLMFVAAVPKGKTVTYTLKAAEKDRRGENSTIVHRTPPEGGTTNAEVGNEFYTLRLPGPGKQEFAEAKAASDVTPPILAWKQAGCEWMGGAHFVTERKVAGYEIRCVDDGPATVAYEARYRFAPCGECMFQVRVSTGVPVALVAEEYDFGEITEGHDFLMLGLGEGWKPEQIGFLTGEGPKTQNKLEPFGAYVERKAKEQQGPLTQVGAYAPPPPFMPGKDLVLLEKIVPGCPWGLRTGIELRDAKQGISVSPMHTGSWRRTNSLIAWHDPARGVQVALPISVRYSHWYLDLTDDKSPFSSHEHDPGLPASYGRREWALGFGLGDIVETRIRLGYIGLDRYKEWVLDWPDTRPTHPCGLLTPNLVERLKRVLDQHPEKDLLLKLYLFDGKEATAKANAEQAIRGFQSGRGGADWNVVGLSEYGQTYQYLWTIHADSALACPTLPAELRGQLRRYLALYSYLLSEPDYNPRGAGVHLGNPNMPIGRTSALGLMAALIPDHPMYNYWMTQYKAITAWRLATNTEPGGAWFEPPIYQFYGPTRALNLAQILIRNAGFGDLTKEGWHKAALTYDINLTVPDARFKGWRIFPGMGNSGNTLEGILGISTGAFAESDPDFAGYLLAMHRLCSGNRRVSLGSDPDYSACLVPDVPEKPRPLATKFIPGYGVIFRAHYGSPDETAMLFRCGYNKSHWDMDDLNVVLYGKGAPLSPGTGYQYYYGPASKNDAVYHNRCKLGGPNAHEPFGRCENVIQDYAFGDSVDYALGREYYPPEYFAREGEAPAEPRSLAPDGSAGASPSRSGGAEWRRHVLFLKSAKPEGANYFVMRDTFPGGKERPAWWHWLNLDGPEMIAQQGNTIDMKTKFGAGTHFWFADRESLDGKVVMTFDYPLGPNYHHRAFGKALGVPDASDKETKTIYQVAAKPGEDFFYVVYPHKDGEKLPAISSPVPGCIKVVTAESTDYCFLSDTPLDLRVDAVRFRGKAGAVRVFPDRFVLSMASGSGRVGYRGADVVGYGPFELTMPLANPKGILARFASSYEKKVVSVDLGAGISVTGEAPFEAKLDGKAIHIRTKGRARVLLVTKPPFIVRPGLEFDGRTWMAFWTDEAGSDWGRWTGTQLIALSTLDGEHELVLRDMAFPPVWDRQFAPTVSP